MNIQYCLVLLVMKITLCLFTRTGYEYPSNRGSLECLKSSTQGFKYPRPNAALAPKEFQYVCTYRKNKSEDSLHAYNRPWGIVRRRIAWCVNRQRRNRAAYPTIYAKVRLNRRPWSSRLPGASTSNTMWWLHLKNQQRERQ